MSKEIIESINVEIEKVNSISDSEKELKKRISKAQSQILTLLEKDLKLVTINHYRNTWMAVGLAAFGIPIGLTFSLSIGNMAFFAIWMPVGMLFGMAIGTEMDKKAFEEGRQIDFEIKF